MRTQEMATIVLSPNEVMGGEFERLFREQLEPLYGDQSGALDKIKRAGDRTTYLLGSAAKPLGVLVIKDAITTEDYPGDFSASGTEIKTLTLFNPDSNSGKGFGRILIEQALGHVQALPQNNSNDTPSLFVTVSSDKPESLAFFKKYNFVIAHSVFGVYRDENTEHILTRTNIL